MVSLKNDDKTQNAKSESAARNKSSESNASNKSNGLDGYKPNPDSKLSNNCTIKSASTLKAGGNFHMEENVSDGDENTETTKHLPMKRRNTLSSLPKTILNLENLRNKKRRLVVSSRKLPAQVLSTAVQSSLTNARRSKTINSDLGILPSVLTKNNFLSRKQSCQRFEPKEHMQITENDAANSSFRYFPVDDPCVNHTNSINLPITSTPKKQHQRLFLLESLVQNSPKASISILNRKRPRSMDQFKACNRGLSIRNTIGFNPDRKGEKSKKARKAKKEIT